MRDMTKADYDALLLRYGLVVRQVGGRLVLRHHANFNCPLREPLPTPFARIPPGASVDYGNAKADHYDPRRSIGVLMADQEAIEAEEEAEYQMRREAEAKRDEPKEKT